MEGTTTTSMNVNKDIKETTLKLIKLVSTAIANDITDEDNLNGMEVLKTMVKAHNMWQEDTQDGVDYIFDILNKKDVIYLLQGDLNVGDIATLYKGQEYNGRGYQKHTRYFRYGQNYPLPTPFNTMEKIRNYLADNAEWIITHLFLFRNNTEEYQTIFNNYIGKLFNA